MSLLCKKFYVRVMLTSDSDVSLKREFRLLADKYHQHILPAGWHEDVFESHTRLDQFNYAAGGKARESES